MGVEKLLWFELSSVSEIESTHILKEKLYVVGLYALGYLIVIVGVAYMAYLMHIPQVWIGAIVLILVGVGIVTGVTNTRQKDSN